MWTGLLLALHWAFGEFKCSNPDQPAVHARQTRSGYTIFQCWESKFKYNLFQRDTKLKDVR